METCSEMIVNPQLDQAISSGSGKEMVELCILEVWSYDLSTQLCLGYMRRQNAVGFIFCQIELRAESESVFFFYYIICPKIFYLFNLFFVVSIITALSASKENN